MYTYVISTLNLYAILKIKHVCINTKLQKAKFFKHENALRNRIIIE